MILYQPLELLFVIKLRPVSSHDGLSHWTPLARQTMQWKTLVKSKECLAGPAKPIKHGTSTCKRQGKLAEKSDNSLHLPVALTARHCLILALAIIVSSMTLIVGLHDVVALVIIALAVISQHCPYPCHFRCCHHQIWCISCRSTIVSPAITVAFATQLFTLLLPSSRLPSLSA